MKKAVRDGYKSVIECTICHCRLNVSFKDNSPFALVGHFKSYNIEKDARGCLCEHINTVWTVSKNRISHLEVIYG